MSHGARQRQDQILAWLRDETLLSIETITSRLDVSIMTVHRDLDQLAKAGLVNKVHGGVELPTRSLLQGTPTCDLCHMMLPERTLFTAQLDNGTSKSACCPHCGVLMLCGASGVIATLTRDFLYGRMVNVLQAFFVVGSTVSLCCAPSVLCFANEHEAESFSRGFSGEIVSYSDLQTLLYNNHQH